MTIDKSAKKVGEHSKDAREELKKEIADVKIIIEDLNWVIKKIEDDIGPTVKAQTEFGEGFIGVISPMVSQCYVKCVRTKYADKFSDLLNKVKELKIDEFKRGINAVYKDMKEFIEALEEHLKNLKQQYEQYKEVDEALKDALDVLKG